MWEDRVDIHEVREIRSKTMMYLGVGAIDKIGDILRTLHEEGIRRLMIVTSRSAYKKCGAWAVIEPALEQAGIEYRLYNGVTPNPNNEQVDEAAKIGRKFDAQAVLGIGGGSPIDTAKSVAVLLAYPEKTCEELYTFAFAPEKAAPIIAVNTTHGTGTEVDRFAVVSIPELGYKPAIAYDCLYPRFAIDDPALMAGLPALQTLYVSIDAVNHVTEAATTTVASPYSILLAKETTRLVYEYLPRAIDDPNDLTARYFLLYASAIAGIAFDNGMLHFTHALEHPLSAIKPDLAHGLGLAMLLPAVLRTIYPATSEVLAEIYAPIVPGLTGDPAEAERLACGVEAWLAELGLDEKLSSEGYSEADLDRLTDLALHTPSLGLLLSMAPVESSANVIRLIYRDSLHPLRNSAGVTV